MLFRKEAIDEAKSQFNGDILVIPKLSHTVIIVFFLIWFVAVISWLFNGHYSRKETVLGWVSSSSGVVRVFPPLTGGILEKKYHAEGDVVLKGDPLFLLKNPKVLFDGEDLGNTIIEQLNQRSTSFEEQKNRAKVNIDTEKKALNQQKKWAEIELNQLKNQLLTLTKHTSVIQDELSRYDSSLKRGSISLLEYNRVQKEYLSVKGSKQALERSISVQKNNIQKFNTELEFLPIKLQDRLDLIDGRLSDLSRDKLNLESQNGLLVTSPSSGKINNIQADVGQKINTDIPLLSIVSSDDKSSIKLLVPIRAAGFVELGQSIDIRYSAFPYQKFGTYKATITRIPDSVLLPREIINLPIDISESVYLVEAKLDSDHINAYGKVIQIKSDMTLSADIILSKRSLFEWLFEPILSLSGRLS